MDPSLNDTDQLGNLPHDTSHKEDYDERNRRENHETGYPGVSVFFDQATVDEMVESGRFRQVFGF